MSDTRIIHPVDEQRVREIVREELAAAKANERCRMCGSIPPPWDRIGRCVRVDCPFQAVAYTDASLNDTTKRT